MSQDEEQTIECGHEAAKHFALAPGYRNLNHGSYGTYPIAVRDALREYMERIEARPDAFIRYEHRTHLLDEARHTIEDYLHAERDTCVFVPNATNGIETILRNLTFKKGDVIIVFSTVYEAFANTLDYLQKAQPFQVETVGYTLPVSDDVICHGLEKKLHAIKAAGLRPRVVLFDTINSLPGVRMPFERLVGICRVENVISCIDGAHGIGQIPLDLTELDPDFFVTNCHKWLYTPRGCAVLYTPVRNQYMLSSTLPTSFYYKDNYVRNFSDLGTLDMNPYLCVNTALRWRARLTWEGKTGEDAAMSYGLDLARRGGAAVAKILGTEVLDNGEGTLGDCAFTNVRLPVSVEALNAKSRAGAHEAAAWIMKTMILERNTSVNVFVYENTLYARLSAPVYVTLEDFEIAGQHLEKLCALVRDGSWQAEK